MNRKCVLLFLSTAVAFCCASENRELVPQKNIGIFSSQNKRESQEDFFYHGEVDNGQLYAVYDGHGGYKVAECLAKKFPIYFSQTSGLMADRMQQAFENADKDECMELNRECGSTAAVVFIKDNVAHCAHVGDSRALLEVNGKVDFVTIDHKPDRADEYIRIDYANGIVFNKRVNGMLAVSRAFGDYGLDKRLIIPTPEYAEVPLCKDSNFLVLATDGLWDFLSNEEVVEILNEKKSSIKDMSSLAKLLALFAVSRGSRDNITVMVVDLLS